MGPTPNRWPTRPAQLDSWSGNQKCPGGSPEKSDGTERGGESESELSHQRSQEAAPGFQEWEDLHSLHEDLVPHCHSKAFLIVWGLGGGHGSWGCHGDASVHTPRLLSAAASSTPGPPAWARRRNRKQQTWGPSCLSTQPPISAGDLEDPRLFRPHVSLSRVSLPDRSSSDGRECARAGPVTRGGCCVVRSHTETQSQSGCCIKLGVSRSSRKTLGRRGRPRPSGFSATSPAGVSCSSRGGEPVV